MNQETSTEGLWPRLDFENNSRGYITLIPIKELVPKDINTVDQNIPQVSIHFYQEKDAYNLYFAIYKWNCYWFHALGTKYNRIGQFRPDSTLFFPECERIDLIYKEGLNFFQTWSSEGKTKDEINNVETAYIIFLTHFYTKDTFVKKIDPILALKSKFRFSEKRLCEIFGKNQTKEILNLKKIN